MNIKEIVDKIPKESDVSTLYYTVADRIQDINDEYLALIRLGSFIGSKFPISAAGTTSEIITVVADGDVTHTRTIKDVSILKVEYRATATNEWECIERDIKLCKHCFVSPIYGVFKANEKQVFLTDTVIGEYQVTYERAAVTLFTVADYSLGVPPSPDWLPEDYHPLLWLRPSKKMAGYYKNERVRQLSDDYYELKQLFEIQYSRDAEINDEVTGDEGDNNR